MRTLNNEEVQQVSGAGIIADRSRDLGEKIGTIVDVAKHRNNDAGKQFGGQLGQAIGELIETRISWGWGWGRPQR